VIEVTEQSILRSFDKLHDAMMELKEQGVSVAIDDLGGGAVSLRDVAILKPEYIKFDRSLIRQIDTSTTKQQIVLSMILFARGIQAQTTAEGIETKEEYETARMCGVNLGQGYYFARPGTPSRGLFLGDFFFFGFVFAGFIVYTEAKGSMMQTISKNQKALRLTNYMEELADGLWKISWLSTGGVFRTVPSGISKRWP